MLFALLRIGWQIKRTTGSHKTLHRAGWSDVVFAFHDRDEIGPRMLARGENKRIGVFSENSNMASKFCDHRFESGMMGVCTMIERRWPSTNLKDFLAKLFLTPSARLDPPILTASA